MKISVFGNPDLPGDRAAIDLIPWLRKKYPRAEIKVEDPAAGLQPVADWLIVDVCLGISSVTEFTDLDQFQSVRRLSVHDYDLATELKLLKKLGRIKTVRIIGVPPDLTPRGLGRR